jgi:cytochrome oxidase Cu insertion factor (SCO1/SenC/PrrC family)
MSNPTDTPAESTSSVLVPLALAAIVAATSSYLGYRWWQVETSLRDGQTVDAVPLGRPQPTLASFTLTDSTGGEFDAADMQGRVWVVSYFFTTCPGSCIRLNNNIRTLHNDPALADVTWLSITCDPANDTVEQLAGYAQRMEANGDRWIFARAELDYVKQVGKSMNLDIYEQSHKAYCIVIDRAGQLHGVYDLAGEAKDVERLKKRLLELLGE